MTRTHVNTDAATGERTEVLFTAEEEAAADTQEAAAAAKLPELAPYQFRAMLTLSGKEAGLDAYLNALPAQAQVIAKAKLDYSLAFHRDNDLVMAAQQALGLTKEQLDGLWLQAASIK